MKHGWCPPFWLVCCRRINASLSGYLQAKFVNLPDVFLIVPSCKMCVDFFLGSCNWSLLLVVQCCDNLATAAFAASWHVCIEPAW